MALSIQAVDMARWPPVDHPITTMLSVCTVTPLSATMPGSVCLVHAKASRKSYKNESQYLTKRGINGGHET